MFYEIIPIILISVVPGYLLTLLDKRLNDIERLSLSFAITFIVIGGSGLVLHMAGLPLWMSIFSVLPIVGVVLWKKPRVTFNVPRTLIIILAVALLIRFLLQFMFPYPIVGDSYFHMDMARTFTGDNWFESNAIDNLWSGIKFPFPEDYRPPFFNFITGFFFDIFGSSFYIAKLVNVFIGTVVILPSYILAKKYGGDRIAMLVAVFVALNPLLINQSMEAEVRISTVYFGLVAFYFLVRGNMFWMYSGSVLGLLYMTHYAPASILMITFLVFYLASGWRNIFRKEVLLVALTFLIVVSPWLVRNYQIYGDPVYTSSKYASMVTSFDQMYDLQKPTIDGMIKATIDDPARIIFIKATNFYRTLFPLPFQGSGDRYWFNFDPVKNFNIILNPISMIVTMPLFIASFFYIIPALRNFGGDKSFMSVCILIGILFPLIWNYRAAFTHNFLFMQLIMIAIAGFVVVEKMKAANRKIVYILIAVLLVAQIPAFETRAEAKSDFGQSWISENTAPEDVIMVRWTNVAIIDFYSDRKTVSIPFEDTKTVMEFARSNNVSYIMLDRLDLDLNKIKLDEMESELELAGVHKISTERFDDDYTNTYWIFKV